jgi:hypothetical protein
MPRRQRLNSWSHDLIRYPAGRLRAKHKRAGQPAPRTRMTGQTAAPIKLMLLKLPYAHKVVQISFRRSNLCSARMKCKPSSPEFQVINIIYQNY